MSDRCFVDTNLLVYWRDHDEPAKQAVAREWLTRLWKDRNGCISTQVLSEFFVTVTQKLTPGLSREEAWADVIDLLTWKPLAIDVRLMQRARSVQETHGLSWWDSLIVAAAQTGQCRTLLTEDLQDGQDIDGTVVHNPFS